MSKLVRTLVFGALSVAMATSLTSCRSKPPKVEPPADAGAISTDDKPVTEATPQVTNKDMGFDPVGSDGGKIAGLSTVFFGYDKSALTAESRRTLSENALWIKNNPTVSIQIEGHTDDRGSVEYNLALGERRAKSVKSYLATLGVDGKRLTVISYGKEKPIATGDTEAAWGKNRRANFVPLAQ